MPQKHDGTIEIAIGKSRKETRWQNKELLWSDLVNRIKETHRTSETVSEYATATKQRQDELKDVGGFVGGMLAGSRRKAGSVIHRQLITLDIDFGDKDVWESFTLLYANAAAMYSTHKHTPESPRLRLIIPLDRPVTPEEYVALSRRVAGDVGIELFDNTTFQPTRLMYWPSTSKDGVYQFNTQDGPWLSADAVLGAYTDWRDSSQWPVSVQHSDTITRSMKKQGDPTGKSGVVGAFCRTYSIYEALDTFLTDEYEATDQKDRYTFKKGSTAAGLVLYEDKFSFSHHGTDPTSGKLCNAFDLVRIHKFGLNDDDAPEGTPPAKMPSYQAMLDFARTDRAVLRLMGEERLKEARSDFEGVELDPLEHSTEWLEDLEADKKGNYLCTTHNVLTILQNDPLLKGRLARDAFEQWDVALDNLPWRKVTEKTRYLVDADDASLRHYLEKTYGIVGVNKIQDALCIHMAANTFHPIRDFLSPLVWDGVPRLDTLLVDYLGAEDSIYTRAVTRKAFVAAVARVFNPGCKFDYALITVGAQGKNKSSLLTAMGKQWFSDSLSSMQGKDAVEQLQGAWLLEMAELTGMKRSDVETVKHFISKRTDRMRVAYGRRVERFLRQCVFFGSTNEMEFLKDRTGNRRFWPVVISMVEPTKNVFADLNVYEVDRIWAEAVHHFKKNEPLFLSPELEETAKKVQAEHTETDDREHLIHEFLETLLPENWDDMAIHERRAFLRGEDLMPKGNIQRDMVSGAEIWCEVLGGLFKDMTPYNTYFIHQFLRSHPGWVRCKNPIINKVYGRQRVYVRKGSEAYINLKLM